MNLKLREDVQKNVFWKSDSSVDISFDNGTQHLGLASFAADGPTIKVVASLNHTAFTFRDLMASRDI